MTVMPVPSGRDAWIRSMREALDKLADKSVPLPSADHRFWCPVPQGSDENRRAAVDAIAAAHGVTARWNEDMHTYEAILTEGPLSLAVYFIPSAVLGEIAGLRPVAA